MGMAYWTGRSRPFDPFADRGIVVSGKGGSSRRLKVSAEPIELANVTGRTLFPSPVQGAWLPFERFAESRSSERNDSTLHSHSSQEVLTYVLDGTVDSEEEGGVHATLPAGWVDVLLAQKERRHELASADGAPARWLSVVLRLPPRALGEEPFLHRPEACRSESPAPGVSLTVVRSPGPQNPSGLELVDLRFGDIVSWERRIPPGTADWRTCSTGTGRSMAMSFPPASGSWSRT